MRMGRFFVPPKAFGGAGCLSETGAPSELGAPASDFCSLDHIYAYLFRTLCIMTHMFQELYA